MTAYALLMRNLSGREIYSAIFIFQGGNFTIKIEAEINGRIRDAQVRVIDENNNQVGIMSAFDANRLAEEKGLDLVKINPTAQPPVCKIMDYGKYKFELSKKEKQTKKNQHVVELKEIRLSMTIDVGDINTKAKQAIKFLSGGDKVKVSIRMKGRQQAHAKIGEEVMYNFFTQVESAGVMEKKPAIEGRNIFMILAPKPAK
jgi:translation initiation factor IF-3